MKYLFSYCLSSADIYHHSVSGFAGFAPAFVGFGPEFAGFVAAFLVVAVVSEAQSAHAGVGYLDR